MTHPGSRHVDSGDPLSRKKCNLRTPKLGSVGLNNACVIPTKTP